MNGVCIATSLWNNANAGCSVVHEWFFTFKEQSPSMRAGCHQTKVRGKACPQSVSKTQTKGFAFPLTKVWWHPARHTRWMFHSDMAKVKVPLRWMSLPSYRSFDPVLTSQLPFKGIKARSLFVYMSAMTPASHHVVAGLGWVNTARCQGSYCLSTGWVSQQRPGGGATKMPERPLGSVREVSWLTCKQKGSSLRCL